MGKKLSKACTHLIVYIVIFFALVWILLGLTPSQTYHQIVNRAISATNVATKTAGDMGRVANHHLNEASDRIHGKDPYQDYNNALDARVRQDSGN